MNVLNSSGTNKFCHLHLHTEYSPLDAPVSLKRLVTQAKSIGFESIAVTDHGTVSSWVKFAQYAKDAKIRPIFGIETYFTPNRLDREKRDSHHLLLLAKNDVGIKNLFRLSQFAYETGFYYNPRIDWELLEQYGEGIVCTTACMGGYVPSLLDENKNEEAKAAALRFKKIFNQDFYMELQHHGSAREFEVFKKVAALAGELGIKTVGTNDVHYIKQSEYKYQEALMALNMRKSLRDPGCLRMDNQQFYLKSPEEMIDIFGGPNTTAVMSTLEIADKCNAEIKMGNVQLPSVEIPKDFSDTFEYLTHLAYEGLKARKKEKDPVYIARLEEELAVIKRIKTREERPMSFDRYFLVVWEYVNWAWQNGIRVGIGRGSGAGSLILYCLRITGIDPIKYDLLFERFLEEGRNEMPDIDIDFDAEKGDAVIEHLREKYGHDRVARIGTINTYHVASAIKASFRVFDPSNMFGKEEREKLAAQRAKQLEGHKGSKRGKAAKTSSRDENAILANAITKELPKGQTGGPSDKCTLSKEKAEKKEELVYVYKEAPVFLDYKARYPEVFDFAENIEGLAAQRGVHAAGVLVTNDPIVDFAPQQFCGKNKNLGTAFDMGDIDKIGGVKLDILRTKVLSVITRALQMIKQRHGKDIPIDDIEPDDPIVLKLFAEGKTLGIFQFESDGMVKLLKNMKPQHFEDLIAANALFRPGPIQHVDEFCDLKRAGESKIPYPAPSLKEVLRPTYGIMVYQEQVMRIVRILAGFTASEADKVRKAMGKKKKDLLAQQKEKFIDGCNDSKLCAASTAQNLWLKMEKFGAYAFNKSHSASYALTAYQSAYLKTYYPAEFMAAQMTVEGWDGYFDTVKAYEFGLKEMKVRLLPININESKADYTVIGPADRSCIRQGFKGIKGLGPEAYNEIVKGQPYRGIMDYCLRSGRGTKDDVVSTLVEQGAFDMFLPDLSKKLERKAERKDLQQDFEDKKKRATREKSYKKEEREGLIRIFDFDEDEKKDEGKTEYTL